MDVARVCIPYSFIRERVRLTWPDVVYGYSHHLVSDEAPSALAADELRDSRVTSTELHELLESRERATTMELVDRLAKLQPGHSDDGVRQKWLYLVLAWLFQRRHEYADSLQKVEEVYADFGYPDEIAAFVRYMPMVGPDLGSREANEKRLLERWQQYLADAEGTYRV